jgi:phosphoglycolate phosphatase-like HAD superfamily hydrolase
MCDLEAKDRIEILAALQDNHAKIKAAVFDFDGTISTLRHGWEGIMEPLMVELISNGSGITDGLMAEVKEYIDQSTGIQTIFQMQWLAETVKRYGNNKDASDDPWWYKAEYNKRLMELVNARIGALENGERQIEDFLMQGSIPFLDALKIKGIEIYAASGTDHPDVENESKHLGIFPYFSELAGAPVGRADCSKEAVLRKLIGENGLSGPEVLVVGDGKVEIALGREVGATTLGIASDEETRSGVNPAKRARLAKAGAHAIVGDFTDLDAIFHFLGI